MRFILLLIDIGIPIALAAFAVSFLFGAYKLATKKKAWDQWQTKPQPHLKDITIAQITRDMAELHASVSGRIPTQAEAHLVAILAILHNLTEKQDGFTQWKNSYSEDSEDLMDILYKHIPESLNRYFSIPAEYTKSQTTRQGHNSNELLEQTFEIFHTRVAHIAQAMVSEKVSDLKHYQTLIKSKYQEHGYEVEFDPDDTSH